MIPLPTNPEELWTGAMFLIDKPLDWTSFDVVNKVRYSIKGKIKVGHAGTLDPRATGLLVLCCGKWTKRLESLTGADKDYDGTMLFGGSTPSYDSETEIDQEYPFDHLTLDLLNEKKKAFTGTFEQFAPIYSALKVKGKKSYELARAGLPVERKKREVTINKFELRDFNLPEVGFDVSCTKGTYIRSLVHDFALAVDSGAYLSALRRTRIGEFHLKDAHKLEDLVEKLRVLTENHER